jgi:hypothetical protein
MDKLQINMSFDLIQKVRLVHALTESSFAISIPASEEAKFDIIKKYFRIQFLNDNEQGFDMTSYLKISHEKPLTSIGQIVRPLIFPHEMTNYCRSLWQDKRKHIYSFQGLITSQRKILLETWIETKLMRKRVRLLDNTSMAFRIKNKIFSKIGLDSTRKKKIGTLLLWESNRGRVFPIKAWDDEYFNILASSEFVLCPSGDYIWSYRFFESALCGAIPIVEKDCSAYSGFRFFSFEDELENMKWSMEDADHNYQLCVEKLTVPTETLDNEIKKILEL